MNPILIALGALVALTLVRPLLLLVVARIFAGAIGAHAVAQQPDEIHLVRSGRHAWKDAARADSAARTFASAGFDDAGTWTVQEMAGVVVQLMANASDGMYAAICEHPKAGPWIDLVTRYTDGTSITFSSNPPTGLNARPGHRTENVPGAAPGALLARARDSRPRRAAEPHTASAAPRDFMRAYAESMAWRKQHGVSAGEVAKVALKKAA
jgi:hypothetical protein